MKIPHIARDFSLQASAGYVSTALQMMRGVFLAALLTPADLGTVAMIGIVLGYALYADLGMSTAVGREIPLAHGAGDQRLEAEWGWYGLVTKVAAEGVVALGVLAYVLLSANSLPSALRLGLLTTVAVVVLQGLVTAELTILQARLQFGRAAVLVVALFGANLIAGVAGAAVAGVRGVFVGQVIAFVFAVGVVLMMGGVSTRVRLKLARLRHLLAVGVPLAVLNFASTNIIYVDQVMVVTLLGRAPLGVYMMVLYAGNAMFLLPQALSAVVGPRLIRRWGERGTPAAITGFTWRPVRLLSLVLPVIVVLTWILVPLALTELLPPYAAAVGPIRIYAVGMFFFCLNSGVSNTLLAMNKHRYNIPIIFGCIALNVVLDVILVRVLHAGLAGIALGSAVTYFVYWMIHMTLVSWFFGRRPLSALVFNLRSGWMGLLLAAVAAVEWRLGDLTRSSVLPEVGLLVGVGMISMLRWRMGPAVWHGGPDALETDS